LALTCEVCGSPIRGQPNRVEIDGAVLLVCSSCAKRGTPVGAPPPRTTSPQHIPTEGMNPDLEVDPDYPALVKTAREKLGLTQEQLGHMINVKPSVISHVETGKMKPDLTLARTLMHQLKVNLLVPSSELDGAGQK